MDTKAEFKKLWLLAIFNAVRAAGVGAATSVLIHRLVYFTTALAVVSRQEPEVACVIKRETGPYFPDYAWELERLVGMGLVTTSTRSLEVSDIEANTLYRIDSRGLSFLEEISSSVESLAKTIMHVGFCVRELAFAGVLHDETAWAKDANQMVRTSGIGDLIDYGEIQASSKVNYSAVEAAHLLGLATEAFDSQEIAADVLRRGIYWDIRERDVGFVTPSFESTWASGVSVTSLLGSHGPSLFARNLAIRQGKGIAPGVPQNVSAVVSEARFAPPEVAWADEELKGVLS